MRNAGPEDLQRIHEIGVAAWRPIYERCRHLAGDEIFFDMFGGWHLTKCRYRREWVANPNPPRVIVTEAEGRVVGFATWTPLNSRAGEVSENAVDPRFQGRGIGTRQVRRIMEIITAQGCEAACVLTWLDPSHAPARAQYRAAGLTRPIPMAWYLNSLHLVANDPLPSGLRVVTGQREHEGALEEIIETVWTPIFNENDRRTDGAFTKCYPEAMDRKRQEVTKRLEQRPETVCVALRGSVPVGFCLVDCELGKNCGTIASLGVSPAARGRGVATALCMAAFQCFRNVGLRHTRLIAGYGEDSEMTRCFANTIGLHRQIPIVGLFSLL